MTNATLNGKVFLALALGAALAVQADTAVYDETTGFVTCVTKKAGYITDASTWSDATDFPNNNTNYYVGSAYEVKCGAFETTKSATAFTPSLYVAGLVKAGGTTGNTMTFSDLRLLSGATLESYNVPTWNGTLTILTPEGTMPVTFSHNRDSYSFKLAMDVVGDANARIVMSGTTPGCLMTRSGDWSGFYGTYTVRDNYTITDSTRAFSAPGTIAFGKGCTFNQYTKATSSFGNLTFGDNAMANCRVLSVDGRFAVGADSDVTISEGSSFGTLSLGAGTTLHSLGAATIAAKLELGDGLLISCQPSIEALQADDRFVPVFYLSPACVAAGLPSLEGVSTGLEQAYLFLSGVPSYRDNPDVPGGKILGVTYNKVITNVSTFKVDQTAAKTDAHATQHIFQVGSDMDWAWSDGQYPQKDCVYYSSKAFVLCEKCVLPDVLVANNGATFHMNGTFDFGDLRLVDGLYYNRWSNLTVTGRVGIFGENVVFQAYLGRYQTFEADLYGAGNIELRSYYPEDGSVGHYRFFGDNSAWSGRLSFGKKYSTDKAFRLCEKDHVRLHVDNSTALGDGTATFAYDTIHLSEYAEILVEKTASFTNACRGVYVETNGAISVSADKIASFAAPFTFSLGATLRKNGAGTLILGGPLKFLSADGVSVVESAGTEEGNVIVNAGSLAVADCNALNGAKLTFADGTALVVSADATGDLKTNGARFDKIAAPFATDVPVRIETADPSKLTETSYSVGLVTVKAADAESVKLSVTSGIRGFRVTSVTSAPGAVADTVTFTATLEKQGLMLILR